MSDLAGFLLARLAEDEAVARDAIAEIERIKWVPGGEPRITEVEPLWCFEDGPGVHVAATPARVLADVAAKRAIVELWRSMTDDWNANTNLDPDDNDAEYLSGASNALYTALKLLALPYAEHADYDEGWRP